MSLFPTVAEKITTQQYQTDDILDKLFPIDPYAICAGGAPRDWHFGRVATDLDIFFCPSPFLPAYIVAEQLRAIGFDIISVDHGEALPDIYKRNPMLASVFNVNWNGIKVQLMRMNNPTFISVLPEFPLSICKAWYKNYNIFLDKDFKRSIAHNIIVKTNNIYNNEHAYISKILAKFPEYRYHENWEHAAMYLLDRKEIEQNKN